ncbi:MAG: hypothetical protein HY318_11825 [Armatimonadetes bacterium]|nr:hypothetical protein [Armatimonadota bacterium]
MTSIGLHERFMQDPVSVRLGNLASNLSRIASCLERPGLLDAALAVIDESKHFIEWTGPEATPDVQPELVRLQVELARWQLRNNKLQAEEAARKELASTARRHAEQVLNWSGLLG